MAKQPYYYLSVVRVSRPYGGFENFYAISSRGWSKINYYRAHGVVPGRLMGKTFGDSMLDAVYLLRGNAEFSEVVTEPFFRGLGRCWTTPAVLDDLGQMLVTQDKGRTQAETALASLRKSPEVDSFRVTERALYLQRQGLIPQNVNIPLYVMINRARGISPETILIALLIRGGKELCNELTELKAKPAPIEVNQTVTPKKDDSPLVDEKKRNEQLEKENASLTKELSDVRLEKFSLRLRNDNLCNHIVNVSRQISALSEDMNKIESPSMDAMALKGIVYGKLIPIAAMNILTHNSNKIDA